MTDDRCSVLIVDDELSTLLGLWQVLAGEFEVLTAASAEEAEQVFKQRAIDILITDYELPGMTGVHLLEWVQEHSPKTVRLLMTGHADLERAVEAINRGGVYYYLLKPWRMADLLKVLQNAAEKFKLERSREQLLEELHRLNLDLEERVQEQTKVLAGNQP